MTKEKIKEHIFMASYYLMAIAWIGLCLAGIKKCCGSEDEEKRIAKIEQQCEDSIRNIQ